MDWGVAWLIFFFVIVLKIPIAAACWLVWHAVRAVPDPPEGPGGRDGDPEPAPTPFPTGRDTLGAEALLDLWVAEQSRSAAGSGAPAADQPRA